MEHRLHSHESLFRFPDVSLPANFCITSNDIKATSGDLAEYSTSLAIISMLFLPQTKIHFANNMEMSAKLELCFIIVLGVAFVAYESSNIIQN